MVTADEMVTVEELLKRVEAGKEKRRQEEVERLRLREERIAQRIPEEARRIKPKFLEFIRKAADEGHFGCRFDQDVRYHTEVIKDQGLIWHEDIHEEGEEGRVRRGALKVLAEELQVPSSGLVVAESDEQHTAGYESGEYDGIIYTLVVKWGEVDKRNLRFPRFGEELWPRKS